MRVDDVKNGRGTFAASAELRSIGVVVPGKRREAHDMVNSAQ
jgi:hypothetical protein